MAKLTISGLTKAQANALAQLEQAGKVTELINSILLHEDQIETVSDVFLDASNFDPSNRIEFNGKTKQEAAGLPVVEEAHPAAALGEDVPSEAVVV